MNSNVLSAVAQLSDPELLARVTHLAEREREATAALIAHLAELDARRAYLAEGCASLFTYCTQVLHLSEHAAYGRIEAARAVRRFPVILERLGEGSATLTTVGLLVAHLTPEHHRDLLDTARHQSKRQVEALVARLRPQPTVPASIRRLPTAGHTTAQPTAPADAAASSQPAGEGHGVTAVARPALAITPPPARPAVVAPLAPERYKVQFTASADTYAKLRLAQDLLRHQIPDGDLGTIVDRALTALVQELAKKTFAPTDRPRGSRGTVPGSRHLPVEVTRAVWLRDGGRCAFMSHDGRRCTEQGFREFHHVAPHSAGGESTLPSSRAGGRGWGSPRQLGPDRVRTRAGRQPLPSWGERPNHVLDRTAEAPDADEGLLVSGDAAVFAAARQGGRWAASRVAVKDLAKAQYKPLGVCTYHRLAIVGDAATGLRAGIVHLFADSEAPECLVVIRPPANATPAA